jgi:hypothetical protein
MQDPREQLEILLSKAEYLEEFKNLLEEKRGVTLTKIDVEQALKSLKDSPEDLIQMQRAKCSKDSTTGIIISAIKTTWSLMTICGEKPPNTPPIPKPEPTPAPKPSPKNKE